MLAICNILIIAVPVCRIYIHRQNIFSYFRSPTFFFENTDAPDSKKMHNNSILKVKLLTTHGSNFNFIHLKPAQNQSKYIM